MRKTLLWIFVTLFSTVCLSHNSQAEFNVGLSIDDEGVRDFHLVIGNHFTVPEKNVYQVRQRSIPDEELAVVFYFASHSGVRPADIVDFRLKGKSWMEISTLIGLNPDIFYVQFQKDPGPPYGKAYGYYKKHEKKQWRKIQLSDSEIADIVNLKVLSAHYQCSPEEIVSMKKEKKSFISINAEFKNKKDKEKFTDKSSQSNKKGNKGKKDKGNGKNK